MSISKAPECLDIILVRGSSSQSTWLCAIQSILMLRSISFSHAVLSLGEGICLHATNQGVHLIRPSELWTSANYQAGNVVLRNKKIKKQMPPESVVKQAHDFTRKSYGARYNYFFGLPKKWIGVDSWFCSQLVADALEQVRQKVVLNRNPERIWPGHFQQCALQSDDWENVTAIYEDYIKEITKGSDPTCTDDCAKTRYYLGEMTFSCIYNKAFPIMAHGDRLINEGKALDRKVKDITSKIISLSDESKKKRK